MTVIIETTDALGILNGVRPSVPSYHLNPEDTFQGTLNTFNDSDFLSTDLEAGYGYAFTMTPQAGAGISGAYLSIFDGRTTSLNAGASVYTSGILAPRLVFSVNPTHISGTYNKEGPWHVEVRGNGSISGTGRYNVDMLREVGNDRFTAALAQIGTAFNSRIDFAAVDEGFTRSPADVDVVAFNLTAGTLYTVMLTGAGMNLQLQDRLASPSGLGSDDTLGDGRAEVTFTPTETGRYLAEITGTDDSVTGAYSLMVKVAGQLLNGDSGPNNLPGGPGNDTLNGFGGNDTLLGNGGDDLIYGDIGNDFIGGGAGNDLIYAGSGGDFIGGGAGNDTIRGGDGADTIYGGAGRNKLMGNDGDDLIYAGSGGDFIGGGAGNDSIYGGSGADTIYAGFGNDFIGGGAGNDVIYAGAGANRIYGGLGNDTIHAGSGKDVMTGSASADVFVFASRGHIGIGANRDVITDFTSGTDKIDLSALDASFNSTGGFTGGGVSSFYYHAPGGILIGDQDGNGGADWVLELGGAPAISAGDFLL